MYAILETGSKQYRVQAGDTLQIERLAIETGKAYVFERVLMVNNDGKVAVGAPTLANAAIEADVVEHIRGEKKIAFKMRRREGYHKTIGHRQELTVVRIKEIRSELGVATAQAPKAEAAPANEPAPAPTDVSAALSPAVEATPATGSPVAAEASPQASTGTAPTPAEGASTSPSA